MAESELLKILDESNRNNLQNIINALEHFKTEAEFIYPLETKYRGGRGIVNAQELEKTRGIMEVLHMAELISKEETHSVIPYDGNVIIYELNEKGKTVFEGLFNQEPKMCHDKHYSTPG